MREVILLYDLICTVHTASQFNLNRVEHSLRGKRIELKNVWDDCGNLLDPMQLDELYFKMVQDHIDKINKFNKHLPVFRDPAIGTKVDPIRTVSPIIEIEYEILDEE